MLIITQPKRTMPVHQHQPNGSIIYSAAFSSLPNKCVFIVYFEREVISKRASVLLFFREDAHQDSAHQPTTHNHNHNNKDLSIFSLIYRKLMEWHALQDGIFGPRGHL